MKDIQRLLKAPSQSFFLFGPRGSGKSTWVQEQVRPIKTIDLLSHSQFLELQRNPSLLEAKIPKKTNGGFVFIDEIQKVPQLLDEVHRLIEAKKIKFALSGSSARNLKRVGANMLAGRAQNRKMYPFCLHELQNQFSLEFLLAWGTLPIILRDPSQVQETLSAYLETYLKEEIKEEALIRRIDSFTRFLEIAGQLNTQTLNLENIGRETGKSGVTIQSWFQIIEETLLGHWIPPFRPGFKVREAGHSKFYWFDAGVARSAAGLLREEVDHTWLGSSFETIILNELLVYNEVSRKQRKIFYYAVPGAGEIDFVVETEKKTINKPGKFITIEVKLSNKWKSDFEGPSRALKSVAKSAHTKMIGVYTGSEQLSISGFDILPYKKFSADLFAGNIF